MGHRRFWDGAAAQLSLPANPAVHYHAARTFLSHVHAGNDTAAARGWSHGPGCTGNPTASEQLHCYSTINHPRAITRDMVCEEERSSGGSGVRYPPSVPRLSTRSTPPTQIQTSGYLISNMNMYFSFHFGGSSITSRLLLY